MPTVWLRDDPRKMTRFHRRPDCSELTKKPSCGAHYPLLERDLDDVWVRPCLRCYPNAPRYNIRKLYCPICESRWPCQHNGGVLITRSHGESLWVWPDSNQMPLWRKQAMQD